MRILVIGASHGIGLATTRKALAEGHVVTAFVRPSSKMTLVSPRLAVWRGDILDESHLEPAVAACEAVAITLGVPPSRKPITLFSEFTRHLLAVLWRTGPRRVLAVSGIGAGDSRGHGGFFYDRIVQPLLLSSNYADKERMEDRLRGWGGDWLVVRPGFLTNGPETGRFDVLTDMTGVKAGKISRADVARFLVQEMVAPTRRAQTVLLTAPR
ncbi:MAG TPA: NAD(P)H-binding protein [Opitutaceae bacterium]